ncbi:gliding motility protein [Streptomyces sp. NPDC002044]|uniref:gliding motility protein n=1 Tax=Streptomyces sp. NPDC002044 TaxID=3154662 RepID=UPI00331E8EB9
MGIFRRFFGGKDEDATEQAAAESLTPESGSADEAEAAPTAAEAQAPAAEAVEIPKQQSAEVAADSEAGEGART